MIGQAIIPMTGQAAAESAAPMLPETWQAFAAGSGKMAQFLRPSKSLGLLSRDGKSVKLLCIQFDSSGSRTKLIPTHLKDRGDTVDG